MGITGMRRLRRLQRIKYNGEAGPRLMLGEDRPTSGSAPEPTWQHHAFVNGEPRCGAAPGEIPEALAQPLGTSVRMCRRCYLSALAAIGDRR